MKLTELIIQACETSPEFLDRYNWRIKKLKRTPDPKWLMDWLEKVLGKAYVQGAAENFIADSDK